MLPMRKLISRSRDLFRVMVPIRPRSPDPQPRPLPTTPGSILGSPRPLPPAASKSLCVRSLSLVPSPSSHPPGGSPHFQDLGLGAGKERKQDRSNGGKKKRGRDNDKGKRKGHRQTVKKQKHNRGRGPERPQELEGDGGTARGAWREAGAWPSWPHCCPLGERVPRMHMAPGVTIEGHLLCAVGGSGPPRDVPSSSSPTRRSQDPGPATPLSALRAPPSQAALVPGEA